jgi:hypothetical protein
MRSWVYRLWVLMILAAAAGSIVYKVGVHREAGIVQAASVQTGDLLRGLVAVSLALVALLAVGSVSSERSTAADAILSRGISRHQYFLAKWHARLVVVLATFAVLAGAVLTAHHFLFDPDLTLAGGLAAIGARLVDGFELVADELELWERIDGADLVITGEGFLDAQSFEGKVVGGVAELAAAEGVPDQAAEVAELVAAALVSDPVRQARRGRHWREVYVAAPVGDAVIEGFVDLLYETDEGLVVIDYKTDLVAEGSIDAAVDRYRLQVAAYAAALEVAVGRPVAAAGLIFLAEGSSQTRFVPDLAGAITEVAATGVILDR